MSSYWKDKIRERIKEIDQIFIRDTNSGHPDILIERMELKAKLKRLNNGSFFGTPRGVSKISNGK